MKYLCLLAALLLSSCSTYFDQVSNGKEHIEDAKDAVGQIEEHLCMQCGDGCIPSELAPFTLCEASTEQFDCEFIDNACQRKP